MERVFRMLQGDWAPVFGIGKKRGGRGGGRKGGGGKHAEPTEEELQAMAEEVEAEAMEEEGDGEAGCWPCCDQPTAQCLQTSGGQQASRGVSLLASMAAASGTGTNACMPAHLPACLPADDASRFRMQRELAYDARMEEVRPWCRPPAALHLPISAGTCWHRVIALDAGQLSVGIHIGTGFPCLPPATPTRADCNAHRAAGPGPALPPLLVAAQ